MSNMFGMVHIEDLKPVKMANVKKAEYVGL